MERLRKIGRLPARSAAQIRQNRLGIGFEKLDRNVFDPERAYDKVAQLGVKLVRIQSGWMRTEQQEGVYDFAWIDSIVDNLRARGMEPWIDLCYGNPLYTESAQEYFGAVGVPPIFTQRERDAWAAYVQATVSHFRGRVAWYEIWNEPNGLFCWKHGTSAAETARFTIETARAIRSADPAARVIGGVVTHIDLPYIAALFENGMADHIDAISFHRYRANELEAVRDIKALRGLINRYNPQVSIVQGESGTQSRSGGAGALRQGAWTPEKQAKYLLRQRVMDLSTEVIFTSHFTSVDMVEALHGRTGDLNSYKDFGYFGVLSADFDEAGFACGTYTPKPSYYALQNLCALLSEDTHPVDLPVMRKTLESPRLFGRDYEGSAFMQASFARGEGFAYAYWKADELMTSSFEGTISFDAALPGDVRLIDPMTGDVYALPDHMAVHDGACLHLNNLPLKDYPLILAFGRFGDVLDGCPL